MCLGRSHCAIPRALPPQTEPLYSVKDNSLSPSPWKPSAVCINLPSLGRSCMQKHVVCVFVTGLLHPCCTLSQFSSSLRLKNTGVRSHVRTLSLSLSVPLPVFLPSPYPFPSHCLLLHFYMQQGFAYTWKSMHLIHAWCPERHRACWGVHQCDAAGPALMKHSQAWTDQEEHCFMGIQECPQNRHLLLVTPRVVHVFRSLAR